MLYVTTADDEKTYSADDILKFGADTDGGFYVPCNIPRLSREVLLNGSANETVAHVLNCFFSTDLTGRDVDLAIGKYPVRLFHLNHRISVIESWHNLDLDFDRMVKNLTAQIRGNRDTGAVCGIWIPIAVRAAVICGAYTQMIHQKEINSESFLDIAVPSGDFSFAMSAWYCRQMGLPIHNIVVCCNDNNNLWEFFNHGELRTGRNAVSTNTPECDHTVAKLLEMLIFLCADTTEVRRFRKCCLDGRTYFPKEEILGKLKEGFYVSVIGQSRVEDTILGAYSTHSYVFGPYSAMTYAGALDYRAKSGENRHIMLLTEKGAMHYAPYVANALGISVTELHKILDS